MAKKQTRRSISVSRATYERLKAFCEVNNISMSQLVETRVNDFLGEGGTVVPNPSPLPPARPVPARPVPAAPPAPPRSTPTNETRSAAPALASSSSASSSPVPMTSAAARYAIEPPPPIIKSKQQEAAPKPAEKRPDQIFTF